jgi:two-component system sensor histidine kinase ChiS
MEGTVIADAVNLASRVEGCTKLFGASFLVSGDAFAALAEPQKYVHRLLGRVRVKGKTKETALYEFFGGDEPELAAHKERTKEAFARGLSLWGESKLEEASLTFAEVLDKNADDGPAKFYLARCREILRVGMPTGWDGVIDLESK